MLQRWTCGVVILLAAWTPGVLAAVTAGTPVSVRIHETAGLDPSWLDAALRVAHAALQAADVEVSWTQCGNATQCIEPRRTQELAIRFVRVPVPRSYPAALPLGDALVDRRTRTGVLATIYVDRVEWLAGVARGDAATLLGHAVAHELGHLLLASTTHSRTGLMRATWSQEEIRQRRAGDWTFTAADAAGMRARLRGAAR